MNVKKLKDMALLIAQYKSKSLAGGGKICISTWNSRILPTPAKYTIVLAFLYYLSSQQSLC